MYNLSVLELGSLAKVGDAVVRDKDPAVGLIPLAHGGKLLDLGLATGDLAGGLQLTFEGWQLLIDNS